MLYLASQREKVKEKWNGAIRGSNHPEIVEECEIPKTVQPTSVIHKNKNYNYSQIQYESSEVNPNNDSNWGVIHPEYNENDITNKKADEIIVLSEEYTPYCMLKRNRFIVDNSSVLLAYLKEEKGGTKYTVDYAEKKDLKLKEYKIQ